MHRSPLLVGAFLLLGSVSAAAQSPSESFNEFRRQILSDFDSFRSRILEHYADFLNGEWHEFEPLWEEESPYTEPKPKVLPEPSPAQAPEERPNQQPVRLPAPKFGSTAAPGGVMAAVPGGALAEGSVSGFDHPSPKIDRPAVGGGKLPGTMAQSPLGASLAASDAARRSSYERRVLRIPDPGLAFGSFPGQIAAPDPGEAAIVNIDMASRPQTPEGFGFGFYGMEAFIPEIDFDIAPSITSSAQTGAHWELMAGQEGGLETARQLFGLAQQMGLNGYLTFRLTEAYANQRFRDSDPGARMSAVHFLLSNMGYDVRLLQLEDRMTVMMPFDQQTVYGTMSHTVDGRKYTILFPEGFSPQPGQTMRLSTCTLPEGAKGQTSDLRLTGLSLPVKPKEFTLTNGRLSVTGTVNENLRDILYRYPYMPMGDFASSWADAEMRQEIVDQVREQLAGMPRQEAVNALMNLCHRGFEYSTDQNFHGFEKPYFLEENFLHEKNDCEDRAIFLSYLLWNALDLPCQLIQYPGHESTAVAVGADIPGCYYDTDGLRYYSADPTYVGSSVGMVMSDFRNTVPTIDKLYR